VTEYDVYFAVSIFIYLYIYIVLHVLVEFVIRKMLKLETLKETPYSRINWAVSILRTINLLGVLLLMYPFVYSFVLFMLVFDNAFAIELIFLIKRATLASWVILVFFKIFYEYKYLNIESAWVTYLFNIPVIASVLLIDSILYY